MPGDISTSYDPEWGTSHNRDAIANCLRILHGRVTDILGRREPIFILDLVDADLPRRLTAILTEKEWRLIRFALERAGESL